MADRREYELAVIGLGGIGSGALYWASRRLGQDVLGIERFEIGHERGASQDHSRIIRLSYHAPEYVRFAQDSYSAWAALEEDAAERLIVKTGGLDFWPEGSIIAMDDYTKSLDACGIAYEVLDSAETMRRWPQVRIADDVRVMYQADSGVAPAAKCNAAHIRMAREHGAAIIDRSPVSAIREAGEDFEIDAGERTYRAHRLVICADAWTNDLLEQFGHRVNLTVTQEQVVYYASDDQASVQPDRFPIWIWMDEPSYYGLPSYDGSGVKIGQDVGGHEVTGDTRSFDADPAYTARLDAFMQEHFPDAFGPHIKIKTCLYSMPPDREFILDFIPGRERAVVGQGAAHAFKFASVYGKSLVELAIDQKTESDVSAFSIDREILTMDDPPRSFMV
ncbi:MAG: N-methyl-L-tryptophan oxidase [Actinomycetota bacterium]